MKNIATVALLIAASFTAAGTAPAQDHRVKATVPFNFTVGSQTLPTGTYTISSDPNSPGLLTIRNWSKKVGIFTLAQPDQDNPRYDNTLMFHKYGNQYFLSGIHSRGASMDVHMAVTKAEKRARAHVEEASLSVDAPVLIALN
jgi:hypothetical protein